MPDNKTPSVLRPTEAQALADWRRLVLADREQVERIREDDRGDYYESVAGSFRPGRRDSVEWPLVASLAQPGDTWLDIGAGGGRFAIPLAELVERVIAVEPSGSMRGALEQAVSESGRSNVDVRDAYWPVADWTDEVDVSLAAHATYDTEDLGAWLDAQDAATRRTGIGVFGCHARGAQVADFFEAVHGEPMATLPALTEFVAVLGARGCQYEVHTVATHEEAAPRPPEDAYRTLRRFLWLREGSERDARMRALADEWYGTADGLALPPMRPWVGVVSWVPRR
ncbi:MAG: methyltransferase domain-containing protein [Chloroflexi bacterium]|nr:methyltransferase domain-containing protein [Chloroflexota bacterium]